MPHLKTIDWDEAMNQVGGDRDFLDEVLADLVKESREANEEMEKAVQDGDFNGIMKAAHRIKGSASYLCCEALRDVSLRLQNAGHDGTHSPSSGLMKEIRTLLDEYSTSLQQLEKEIGSHK
eukprot:gene6952-9507_t